MVLDILGWLVGKSKTVVDLESDEASSASKLRDAKTGQERIVLLEALIRDDKQIEQSLAREMTDRLEIVKHAQKITELLLDIKTKEGKLSKFEEDLLAIMSRIVVSEEKKVGHEAKVEEELLKKEKLEERAEIVENAAAIAKPEEQPNLLKEATKMEKQAEGMTIQEYNDERTTRDEF
jgi:hypothetical protein